MYVYIRSEPQLYTVGYYDPAAGSWGEYQHIKAQHAGRPEASAGGGE